MSLRSILNVAALMILALSATEIVDGSSHARGHPLTHAEGIAVDVSASVDVGGATPGYALGWEPDEATSCGPMPPGVRQAVSDAMETDAYAIKPIDDHPGPDSDQYPDKLDWAGLFYLN